MKNKFVWFLVLLMVACGMLFKGYEVNSYSVLGSINVLYDVEYYDDSYADVEYYDDSYADIDEEQATTFWEELPGAIFMHLFISIHMSIFVLFPIASIFSKNNSKSLFIKLFITRVIILILGDLFISPMTMAICDFFAVFVGAFLVVPILAAIKGVKLDKKSNRVIDDEIYLDNSNYVEVDRSQLRTIGFDDKEILKRALFQHYVDIVNACNSWDRDKLNSLCDFDVFMDFKTDKELYEKVQETKINDRLEYSDIKLIKAIKENDVIYVDLIVEYKCCEYVLNKYNQIIRGSNTKLKKYIKLLSFSKKLSSKFITECPNCNAPINDKNVEFCGYCGTLLNYDIGDWILNNELIIAEDEKES